MRFQKRIKFGKLVTVNISKGGISVTIGIPGLSLNFGPKGVFLNTGLPGTGVSKRTQFKKKIGGA